MRRTQLYLEDDMWKMLRANAATSGLTVSELVRRAVREKYLGGFEDRQKAMQAFVGLRAGRREPGDSAAYVRSLRRGHRLAGLSDS